MALLPIWIYTQLFNLDHAMGIVNCTPELIIVETCLTDTSGGHSIFRVVLRPIEIKDENENFRSRVCLL